MSKSTLVIGDTHVEANDNLDRFDVLGNFIVDKQPDHIVQIGDFLSLDSLSAWDLNKRAKMEGRRFSEELKNGKRAVFKMMEPLRQLRAEQKKKKKKLYSPRMIAILGNHEDRWYRYLDTHPELIDVVDIYKSIGFNHFGWEQVAYRDYAYIEGIAFTHIPMNGTNQPISGMSMMTTASRTHTNPVVFGHTHRFAIATDTRHGEDSTQILSVNVGCYFEDVPEYAKGSIASKDWWRGLIVLDHYDKNKIDVHTYSMESLKRRYKNCQI